ncbi:PhaM family polyhydroxyalkanoate granule multifunctional regulatory protein [Herbaspirillum chlorophenolicum]|uniref:PhaM family polyhydroxyalkanoate granule multifunctional regulatory protein n=1 Tax=Herbaspirillum chlorophenolicum TaxID=211589 RepID=UPI00067B0FB0|nr:PhaM family polyhydroxyalkanoate granule multifunctional regulatory protein [Herbaspirillum chlorophenolicum]
MLNQEKMPGAGSVADTIEFMKQIWGNMGAPSMVTPSLSVDDINKKISDLKTVASWLELNLNMLKGTIQAMEVQSATLSTLQAMSAIMASRAAEPEPAPADESEGVPPFPFGFPMWPGSIPAKAAEEEAQQEPAPVEVQGAQQPEHSEPEPVVEPDGAPDFQSAIANPSAWWNVLQEQFKHAVGNAMAGGLAEQEPLLKPVKPADARKMAKSGKTAKRSENKTTRPAAKPAPKARPKPAAKRAAPMKKAEKPGAGKPVAKKVAKSPVNTSTSAKAGVVQSRQNKKPASRKPTSP